LARLVEGFEPRGVEAVIVGYQDVHNASFRRSGCLLTRLNRRFKSMGHAGHFEAAILQTAAADSDESADTRLWPTSPVVVRARIASSLDHRVSGDAAMGTEQTTRTLPRIALPSGAPRIRATVGVGGVGQKTLNLRRVVSLLGSGSRSSIVLRGPDVSKAHCVIINAGRAVLLMDLRSEKGTLCNGEPVNLKMLSDGDVVQISNARIQIAINSPVNANMETAAGVRFTDPLEVDDPVTLRLIDGSRDCLLDAPVCLAGRLSGLPIHLAHQDVSLAHALFTYCDGRALVADLGSRTGTFVNGEPVASAFLNLKDRVRIGPAEFEFAFSASTHPSAASAPPLERESSPSTDSEVRLQRWADELAQREEAVARREKELQHLAKRLEARQRQLEARAQALTVPAGASGPEATEDGPAALSLDQLAPLVEECNTSQTCAALERARRLLRRSASA
jgi:pSer/pThr/pTyr-binding forkhead associated (FHA) protein